VGTWIELAAEDGHRLGAYRAEAKGKRRGGLVVLQEIFGVNAHMRDVANGFAAEGYECVAPAMFDRVERGIDLGYGDADIAKGRDLRAALNLDKAVLDMKAAAERLAAAGKVASVGYCWGGSLAWLTATRLPMAAVVGYYGGQIVPYVHEKPRCPVMLHFGEKDTGIPLADVETIRRAHPQVTIHLYPAGHGFNVPERASYDGTAAKLARERTLAFLAQHLG
jgi:carboxymethylenebutenolidase